MKNLLCDKYACKNIVLYVLCSDLEINLTRWKLRLCDGWEKTIPVSVGKTNEETDLVRKGKPYFNSSIV
jgi:hypothetical protein